MILENVAQLPERYKRELIRGEHARAEFAIHEQRRLKEASDLLETRHIEGLGQKVLSITLDMATRLRMKFGMACLHDPDFRRKLLQRNPFLRVRSIPQKTTVRVDGLRESGKSVRQLPARSRNEEEKAPLERRRPMSAQGDPATPFNAAVRHPRVFSGHEATSSVSLAMPSRKSKVESRNEGES